MKNYRKINHSIHTTWSGDFRDRLRGTWVHHVIDRVRTAKRGLLRQSEGEAILLQRYRRVHGKPLDMTNPRTFTEKLFCRMISWNRGVNPIFTQLTDKYSARAYVASKVGKEYLIKLLWHGEDPRAIPFDSLSAEYVIKPSHASQRVIVVKGYAARDDIVGEVSGWLNSNYYWAAREYQYYHINPKIMIEECLRTQDGSLPLDYKFWCFNGVPELIQVINHTRDNNSFFDTAWNLLDLHNREGASRRPIPKPANLELMLSLASQLSADFDFVRVDLYTVRERVYFGELTFTPTAGKMNLKPESWDWNLGEKWDLSLDC